MNKLKFGIIGTGWITEAYIDGAIDSGLWELSAVYSRTLERGLEFGKKYGVDAVFTDVEEMASFDGIDAVYIASPNYLHVKYSKLFLDNGKHVICEKPVSSQPEQVEMLIDRAKEKGLVFMEAIMYMHMPQREALRSSLHKLGDISFAKFDFCQRSSKYNDYLKGNLPNIFNPEMETGALMDLGIYCVYPAIDLFGEPDSFNIDVIKLRSGADGCGAISLIYKDKIVSIPYSKLGQASENSEIQGNLGTISIASISRLADIRFIDNDGNSTEVADDDEKYKLMAYEAKDFFKFITDYDNHKNFLDECSNMSIRVAKLLNKLRKSAGIVFPSDK